MERSRQAEERPQAEHEVAAEPGRGLREWWRKQWEFGSHLHLSYPQVALLLGVFVMPSVAGWLWGPLWGVPLGGVALGIWLVYGWVPYLGEHELTVFLRGMLGIMVQIYFQMLLFR